MAHTSAPVRIIGLGNRYRRDDGAGLAVLQELAGRDLPGQDLPSVELRAESGEGAALMEAWQGAQRVILVDAVQAGGVPGTIYRLDPWEQPIPTEFFHYSTHAFSLAEAVELARVLGQLPPALVIYGIQGADFGAGEGLSPPVAAAVPAVTDRIIQELAQPMPGG